MNSRIYKLITYTAFSKHPHGGNLAGIVQDNHGLSLSRMQEIAKQAGYSETLFISSSHEAVFTFHYFTPSIEVSACGHATLAGLFYLKNSNQLNKADGTLQTKGGIIQYRYDSDRELFFIRQPVPEFDTPVDSTIITRSLGISTRQLNATLPIQKVSTGLWDIIIPVKDKEILTSLKPDFNLIKDISIRNNATGYHVFSLGTENYHACCRNFAPAAGIPEEAATGTASGALAAYLNHHNVITSDQMLFRQGESLKRPSDIHVIFNKKSKTNPDIWVGGYAVLVDERNI